HVHADGRHVAILVGYSLRRDGRPAGSSSTGRRISNELGDDSLAGRANENRVAERNDPLQLDEGGKRVTGFLREADTWIDGDASRVNSSALHGLNAFFELG